MPLNTSKSSLPVALLAVLSAALAGCEQQTIATPAPDVGAARRLSLRQAASRLEMRVHHAGRASATLRDGTNTVVLYPDPGGEVYVNGRAVPATSGVRAEGSTLTVPLPLIARICPHLRTPPPSAPAPVRTPRRVCKPRPTAPAGTVVIDPGHGGKDPGATSIRGTYEKHIVLAVSKLLRRELERRNIDAHLTRSGDRFLELEQRPEVARRLDADLFVSVHADSFKRRAARGFTVFVERQPDAGSLMVANRLVKRLAETGTTSRGVRRADYRVLVHADCPAALIELGFLSNRAEAALLEKASHQRRLARALAAGIVDYLQAK